ncbi:MAG: beta-eliminating lyase-related protein, partial [Alphaproteobacteria bacterium]|nr:beta-eliminating lyase-related protein [Alphaproteobacteria bacterium]
MNFCSDNTTGISPEILAAISAANQGSAMPYGGDDYTKEAEKRINDLFETSAEVYLVGTGTAANSLALSTVTPPYGSILCHKESHIAYDETGAPEFYTGGAKLTGLDGEYGKITTTGVEAAVANTRGSVHQVLPSAVSLTQSTEFGALYTLEEIKALCSVAHKNKMKVHMDGARFANAVAALG